MPELILGLDVGSTSTRAYIVDLTGRVHGRAMARLESKHAAAGCVEQDPRVLWSRVEETIVKALAESGYVAADLAAVGLSAQRSSVVVWDRASGEPVGPMILWSDLRGTERATELQAGGFLVPALAAAAKLEAALDAIDDGRARAAAGELAWGTLDSFVAFKLSGGDLHITDYSNAWSSCYLDLATMRTWNTNLIDFQNLPIQCFPKLCDTFGQLGQTNCPSLGSGIPISAIVADQQSGMFAHNALGAGRWKATYGTSATLMVSTGDTPKLVAGLMPMLLTAYGDETIFAVEGMVISAGALLDWLIRDLGLFKSIEELTRAAASIDRTDGVAIRPALQGLGAPYNDSTARGAVVGLSSASGPRQIARASLESLAFRMREIAESAANLDGIELPSVLPVDGGLSTNDVFLQIQADVLGRTVARHHEREATALGACIAAARGLGLASHGELQPLMRTEKCFEPMIDKTEADDRFARWQELVG